MKKIITICSIFWATLQLHAQGTIIPNGITYYINGWYSSINIMNNDGYAQVNFYLAWDTSSDIFVITTIAGHSDARIFSFQIDQIGDPFTLQGIQSDAYTELTLGPPWSGFSMTCEEGAPFYLGFYTGTQDGYDKIFTDPVLGWGLFENVGGIIKMLDSGLESGGDGIIVGTLELVPEPTTCAVFLFGLAGFLGFRKRLKNL